MNKVLKVVFLDDNPTRQKKFKRFVPFSKIVSTVSDCIKEIKKSEKINYLFLDHDLGEEMFIDSSRKDCGMEVVRWICDNKPEIDEIFVHTMNIIAGKSMVKQLKENGYRAMAAPFFLIKFEGLSDFLAAN